MQTSSGRPRRAAAAWAAVTIGVLAAGLAWNAAMARAQEQPPELTGDVQLGAQLYAQQCAQCHASDGRGAEIENTGRRAPPLAGVDRVTAAYVDLVMRTGRMPPAADPFDNQPREVVFGEEERAAVVAYTVRQFGLDVDLPDVAAGDPARGQEVYATNCAACHGSTGAGGVAGAGAWTPNVNQYSAVTLAEAIRVGPFQMPRFDAGQISDQEIGDIAGFLEEVRAEEGTPLGLTELNPVFASGFVALLAIALLVSLAWISSRATWFPDPEAESEEDVPGGDT